MSDTLRYKLLSEEAKAPFKATSGAVGFDLSAAAAIIIPPYDRATVPLGVALNFPPGCYGRLTSRSGLVFNSGVRASEGVIDPDYVGEIKTVLFNYTASPYEVKVGDRVVQIVCERYVAATLQEAPELEGNAARGGFGSTGV